MSTRHTAPASGRSRRAFLTAAAAATLSGAARASATPQTTTARPTLGRQSGPSASGLDAWVEVAAGNFRHNLAQISARAAGRPVLAVIKNNGYGAGVVEAARAMTGASGLAGFAVVKQDEAFTLRDAGITAPILMMGPFTEAELGDLAARDITPMVYTPVGSALEQIAARRQKPVSIHVCVDTGIGRVGVPHREAEALITDLAGRPGVQIDGTMMTFAEDPVFDIEQQRRFTSLLDGLGRKRVTFGRKHAASSFALFQRPDAFLDMVRPGMAVFGVYSEPEFRGLGVLDLRPAVALKARVIYVKQLQAGDSAGYNRAYLASAPTWIATLPIGHADGLPRGLVKNGRVRIGERMYPFIGTISASHSMVEVGAERTVQTGDVVTVFDGRAGSRPEDLGVATGSSVYDLLMHLNPLLPRRVV